MTKNFLLTLVFVFWLWPMFTMLELRLQTKCAHKITHGRLYCSTIGALYVVNLSSNFSVKSNFQTLIKGRKAQCARGKKFRATNKNAKITKESFGLKITKVNFKVEKIPLFNSKDII